MEKKKFWGEKSLAIPNIPIFVEIFLLILNIHFYILKKEVEKKKTFPDFQSLKWISPYSTFLRKVWAEMFIRRK